MSKIVLTCDDQVVKALAEAEGLDFECSSVPFLPSQNQGAVLEFPKQDRPKTLAQIESEVISQTLVNCRGNFTEVAKVLGIGRATLYRKVKEYNIDTKVVRKTLKAA